MSMDRPVARGRSVVCAGETTRSGSRIGYARRRKKEMKWRRKRSKSTKKLEGATSKKKNNNNKWKGEMNHT